MSWRFKLCGQGEDGPIVDVRPPLDNLHADSFRSRFSIPKDEKLHFHFEDEDCKKLRPFKDLYERWTLEKVDGRLIFLHSKAPLRLASRPVAKDNSRAEEHTAVGNELHAAFEDDELSQAEIEAEKKTEEQYDISGDAEQSPVEPQAENNSDEPDYVSEDSEHSELGPQVEKNSDEQHDVSDDNERPRVEDQVEESSDHQHNVAGDDGESQIEHKADEDRDLHNEAQGHLTTPTAEPQSVAGEKYMVLVQGGVHPHGTPISSVGKTDHQCKIRFRVERHGDSVRDWSNFDFQSQEFMTSETTLLCDLPGMIKERLAKKLDGKANVKKNLAKRYRRIFFRLSVSVDLKGRVEIDLHDPKYGLRFRTVQDLLLVPDMKDSQLGVIVRAGSKLVEQPADSSERRASRTQLEQIAATNMIQAIPLDEKVNSSVFRRIGDYETVSSNSGGQPYARPLIAEVENDKIELRKGDASIFGDELVGDVRNGATAFTGMNVLKDYELAPQYTVNAPDALNKTNLFALIHEAGPPADNLEKLPILPALSFNLFPEDTFDTTTQKSPRSQVSGDTQRSSDSMTAVVRFVNHLTCDKGRELVFDNNTELLIEENDTYAVAEKAVIDSMEEFQDRSNGWDAFKPDSTISCYLELFVRPQFPAPQKLFRIPTTGEGSDGKMIQFLSPQEVNKDNRTVYMEAHVWPKERLLPDKPAAES
ncbi:hypothetical protein KC332_g12278 [Hortaea werneckii]|uniref:Uncharacterized protein n=2 Tax=Hortaea werneckii TaxID=91943 RepID=A0A3M7I760_HORWE|nr:hypothetical protein KC358_g10218 [Hortaea werneckii]OTA32660.1 hypothetical protein BTJ68_07767 [Hortaea werneckii EXF-2000]KAI6836663.1 hypothetical protein KC350_g6238 [Hortaea werneckii]KAI6918288.1 hypothetical protein KC348_g10984 [Hortaea werneckii]KAI6930039.1 hypothetical protein KC341_g10484 [Hortaea werneckii]